MAKDLEQARTQKTDNEFTNKRFEEFKKLDASIKKVPDLFAPEKVEVKGNEDDCSTTMGRVKAGVKKDMASLFGAKPEKKNPDQLKREAQMKKLEDQRQKNREADPHKHDGIMNIEAADILDFWIINECLTYYFSSINADTLLPDFDLCFRPYKI